MPSTTSISGYTFQNWGPVTTTFTAPSSCTSNTDRIQVGPSSSEPIFQYGLQCSSVGGWECMPSATIESTTTVDLSPTQFFKLPYYSPGLYCPAEWVTVGVASWDEAEKDKPTLVSSGVFKPKETSENMAPGELLLDVLDKSETAVLCCPKSFSAHLSYGCYSTIPSYKPSSACNWEVPKGDIKFSTFDASINGTATSRYIQVPASTSEFVGLTTTTFDKEDKETMVGIAVQRIVTMIHKKGDFDEAGPTNQAVRFTPGSVWSGIGPVIGISVAAMGLGAAMILL